MDGIIIILCSIIMFLKFVAGSLRQVRSDRFPRKVADPKEKRVVCYYANWAVYRYPST